MDCAGDITSREGPQYQPAAYDDQVTIARDELHQLVEQLPDDQVPVALHELRRMASEPEATEQWPPVWFGSITAGRSDTSERVDEILAEGFGS